MDVIINKAKDLLRKSATGSRWLIIINLNSMKYYVKFS